MPKQIDSMQAIKAELNKANVDHEVALRQYEAVMVTIRDQYGFTTLEEIENELKTLRAEIPTAENRRDAMLAEAQGILQKMGMEGSNGTTKKVNVQRRKAPTTNKTVATNRRGTIPSGQRTLRQDK